MRKGKPEIFSRDGLWYWRVRSRNNKILVTSLNGYKKRRYAKAAFRRAAVVIIANYLGLEDY